MPGTLRALFGIVVVAVGIGRAGFAGADIEQLPNLSPQPPVDIAVSHADDALPDSSSRALRFTTVVENLGAHALEIRSIPKPEELNSFTRSVEQCVRWVSRVCALTAPAGTFVHHAQHDHWHFENYATYDLLPAKEEVNGYVPDFGAQPVAPGVKASFCLLDSERARPAPENLEGQVNEAYFYRTCTEYMQGISSGWADEYSSLVWGQQIVIDDVSPGVYALVISSNPIRLIHEDRYNDNVAWAVIELTTCGDDWDVRVISTGRQGGESG